MQARHISVLNFPLPVFNSTEVFTAEHLAYLRLHELRKVARVNRISVLNFPSPVFNSTEVLTVEHARIYGHVNYEKSRA